MWGPPAQCISLTQSSANVHNNALHKDVDDNDPWSSFGIINVELMGGLMADYYTADSFNNNCYYTVEGNKLFQVGFTESYTTLADLNAAYGFAANSVFGDPEYVDAANGDLNIATGSSVCFDTGATPARWFTDDINYETRQRWDIGADYIAPSIYSISGNIIASTSGPLANVIIRGSNTVPDSVITAEDGYYFFTALAGLDITIIPEKEGYDFEPISLIVNNIQEDTVQDFIAIEWTPNSPTDGLPQGTDVPINTAELSWTHPAGGVTPTQYLVTMSIEGIPVNGFNNVEVIYPTNSLTIPGGTLIYSTSYQVEVTANYTAPVRSSRKITVNGDKRGDSAPLVWDFITENAPNTPPVADAGDDDEVLETAGSYTLDGTGSYDPDGQAITYFWDGDLPLDDPTSATPTFNVPDVTEDIIFEFFLVVDDGFSREASEPDSVYITVLFVNQPPIADAGEDDSVTEGEEYQLDGTGSYDPDGQELTYQWIVPSSIQLSDPYIASPTFMAPEVNYDTEYEFELQVDDGYGREIDNDWVIITVLNYIDPNSVCATEPIPENGAQSVAIDAQIGWTYIHDDDYTEPLGFRVLIAYDEELTDPVEMYYSYEGEGVYLFEHSGPDFEYETQYFWQVIPTTDEERGDAVDCPVWYFTTVEPPTYTVSGYVGVDLLVDLGSGYFTDTNGDYSITVLAGSDLTLTPVFEGYDFEPETVTFSDIQEDIIQNFVAESWCPEAPTDGLPQGPDIPIDVEELSWTSPAEGVTPTRYFITLSDHSNYMNPMLNAVETVEPHYSLEGIGLDYYTNYYVMVVPNFTPEGCEEGCDGPALEWNFTTVPLVHSNDPFLPVVTVLHGNYPNPFNPSTTISFSVKEGETGTLKIFNMIGQVVLSEIFTVGEYNYEWSSRKNASGIYFYTLTTVSYSKVKKMILLK